MKRLANRTALISGAARGIGRAIALKYAQEGCNLALFDLNLDGVRETAAMAGEHGIKTAATEADVTDRASIERALEMLGSELGTIDTLVNNAGIFENAQFEEATTEHWQRMIDINLTGVFHVTQCFIRQLLKAERGGAIVNLASISGIVAFNGSVAYSVTKAGLIEMTKCLAMEYGQYGIRTNAMAPGIIATEMTRPALAQPDMAAEWMQRIPMRQWGTVDDVADLALFLASEEARYINGEIVVIDGGAVPAFSKPGDAERAIRRDWP